MSFIFLLHEKSVLFFIGTLFILLQSHYFRNKSLTERSHAQMSYICNCIAGSQRQVHAAHSGMQLLLLSLLLLIIIHYFLKGTEK